MNRNMRRNGSAVSPVIATILLVSITVVLAGALFMWISQILDTGKTETTDMSAEIEFDRTNGVYRIVVNDVSGQINLNDVVVEILGPGGEKKRIFDVAGDEADDHRLNESGIYGNQFLIDHTVSGTDVGVAVGFQDAAPANGQLDQDDMIILRWNQDKQGAFGVGGEDVIRMYDEGSGNVIFDQSLSEA